MWFNYGRIRSRLVFRSGIAAALGLALFLAAQLPAHAAGGIDPSTLISRPLGQFGVAAYVEYQAMFDGVTSNGQTYRVPCQIIAPATPSQGSGLLLFDWLNPIFLDTQIGHEGNIGRIYLTDPFLFAQRIVYATVRSQKEALGAPWFDGVLDTSSEFIKGGVQEFDIVVDFIDALDDDAVTAELAGPIERRSAFGYSNSGARLRGFLQSPSAVGVF